MTRFPKPFHGGRMEYLMFEGVLQLVCMLRERIRTVSPSSRRGRALYGTALALAAALSFSSSEGAHAAFPGANGRIAFVRNGDIYTMKEDGSAQRRVTEDEALEVSPAWSPDGRRIAFASNRDGQWRIYVMNSDGSNQRPITAGPWDREPTWSPDGTRILFHRSLESGSFVYSVPAAGGAETSLVRANVEIRASWSADGRTIAYTSNLSTLGLAVFPWEIHLMNPDGSDQRRAGVGFAPDWSPDSRRLAFVSTAQGTLDIFTMNPDGTDQRRLTSTSEDETRPAWSPDGTKLAFVTFTGALKVINADGTGEVTLASGASSFLGTPDWQPATDVRVAFAVKPRRARVGHSLTYDVRVRNGSPLAADGLRLRLRVSGPAVVRSHKPSQGSCVGTRIATCSLGILKRDVEARVRLTVRPHRAGTITIHAAATTTAPDATDADNDVIARTLVRRPA